MRKRRNQAGFVISEGLIASALLGLGVLAISAFALSSARTHVNIEQSSQNYDLIDSVRAVLGSPKDCTANFKGSVPTDTSKFPDMTASAPGNNPIQSTDTSGALNFSLKRSDTFKDLQVLEAGVRHKSQIAANLHLMVYEVTISKSPKNGTGAKILTTRIPFSMVTDVTTGKTTSCFTDPFASGSLLTEDWVCVFSSGGRRIFDPANPSSCVDDYDIVTVTGATPTQASCDGVGTALSCSVNSPAVGPPVSETYSQLSTQTINAPGSTGTIIGNVCTCDYVVGYQQSSSDRCVAQCAVPKPTNLNLWPVQPVFH